MDIIFQTFILLKEEYELPIWVTREKLEEHGNGDVPCLYIGFFSLICEKEHGYSWNKFGTPIAHASIYWTSKLVAESSMMLGTKEGNNFSCYIFLSF